MNYSFRGFIEGRFSDKIKAAVEEFIANDNFSDAVVRVRYVNIEDIDYRPLSTHRDHLTFPVVLMVSTTQSQDGDTFKRILYIKAEISGTFTALFEDFKIVCCSGNTRPYSRFPVKYTDDLHPIVSHESIERDARYILSKGYSLRENPVIDNPAQMTDIQPFRVNPIYIARKEGCTVLPVTLSDDGKIRGEYFFEDRGKMVYHENSGAHRMYSFKAMTILIEARLKAKLEVLRFTVMHELVHKYCHFYCYWLARMCNPDFTSFYCPIRNDDGSQFIDPFVEKMERYADAVAACALMPATQFCLFAENWYRTYGRNLSAAARKMLVEKTAEFFGVSVSACRKRFIELGYTEMRGIFVFLDGHYVPPFSYDQSTLEKNQTYVVTADQARLLIEKNPKLSRMVMKGKVRFVENHLVINRPEFVTKDGKLTDDARDHLESCALKVDLVFPDHRFTSADQYLDGGMYRSAVSCQPLNVLYAKNNETFEEEVKNTGALLQERDADIFEVLDDLPGGFIKALRFVIVWMGVTEEEFAAEAHMNTRTLGRLLSGETTRPTPQLMMRICMGNKIPTEISIKLMEKSGNPLGTSKQDLAYLKLLFFSGYYTIEQSDIILRSQGVTELSAA
jgi:Zn-dependent peptidase ImmA (M78 family)